MVNNVIFCTMFVSCTARIRGRAVAEVDSGICAGRRKVRDSKCNVERNGTGGSWCRGEGLVNHIGTAGRALAVPIPTFTAQYAVEAHPIGKYLTAAETVWRADSHSEEWMLFTVRHCESVECAGTVCS